MMRIKERRVVDRFLLYRLINKYFFSDKKYQKSDRPKIPPKKEEKRSFQKLFFRVV